MVISLSVWCLSGLLICVGAQVRWVTFLGVLSREGRRWVSPVVGIVLGVNASS